MSHANPHADERGSNPGIARLSSRTVAGRVLVVDDDRELCELIVDGLRRRDFAAVPAYDERGALDALRTGAYDVVAVDVQLGRDDGIGLCSQIIENNPGTHVVIMTGHADLQTAVMAIRAGAYDFITKPLTVDALVMSLQRAIEHRDLTDEVKRLREASAGPPRTGDLIGDSPLMRRVYQLIEQVATSDAPVLVTGERGTGKDLVARAIHHASARRDGPFVVFDCSAVAPSLLEHELFGVEATPARASPLVQASGGTLLLSEIGDLPTDVQATLLGALEERRVVPAGAPEGITFDTRIVAATSSDIGSRVEQGAFREDLYYAVNVVRIPVPPLRSRGRDILVLAQHFLDENAASSGKDIRGFTRAAADKLLGYDWPGNVRELGNCISRAVALTRFDEITPADFPETVATHRRSRIVISGDDPEEMPTLAEVEGRYVRRVLEAVRHNKSHAARVLGIDQRGLHQKLERLEIDDTA